MTRTCVAATLLVCSNVGRLHFLARASRSLPPGEVLVQVRDLLGLRRTFQTVPTSARAVLVAREPPLVLRGSLTALVTYYRVPAGELGAVETHTEEGQPARHQRARLRVVCEAGRRPPRSPRYPTR